MPSVDGLQIGQVCIAHRQVDLGHGAAGAVAVQHRAAQMGQILLPGALAGDQDQIGLLQGADALQGQVVGMARAGPDQHQIDHA